MAALGIEAERRRIFARKLDEAVTHGLSLSTDAVDLRGRILHADDVLQFEEPAIVSTLMSMTDLGGIL